MILFGFLVIWTVLAFAGRAPFSQAWMMCWVFFVVPLVTFVAEVRLIEESLEGVAPVVMTSVFEHANDLVGQSGSHVGEHVRGSD